MPNPRGVLRDSLLTEACGPEALLAGRKGVGAAGQHLLGWEARLWAYSEEEGLELPFPEAKPCWQSNGSNRR